MFILLRIESKDRKDRQVLANQIFVILSIKIKCVLTKESIFKNSDEMSIEITLLGSKRNGKQKLSENITNCTCKFLKDNITGKQKLSTFRPFGKVKINSRNN